jgi:polyisoprenoid-binding protein YceI
MKSLMLAAAVALAALPAAAQQAATPAPAPAVSKNPAGASAGAYRLDPRHASVIARVDHMGGLSKSVFRFNEAAGTLDWNPTQPERSQLTVTVDPRSIDNPVAGFAEELGGERFLNVAAYPEMKFVSRSIQRTGPDRGRIIGDLTFLGVTRPLTLDTTFNGWRKNNRGVDSLGFTATGSFKRSDFGFSGMAGAIGDQVDLVIDVEFNKAS